jgi:Transposase DDE domain group 1
VRDSTTTQCVLFEGVFGKPLHARFDQLHASSDGGAVVLAAIDHRIDLIDRLATCLEDGRDPSKRQHELRELIAQRVFGLACGYEDANDAARLADDPVHKLLVGRDPVHGAALASQPTLSRFENSVDRGDLLRMSEAVLETVLTRRMPWKVKRLTLDLDVTDDPTHGVQQLSFFNGHYGSACYLPLLAFVTFNGEPDQHLVAAMLRPGNAPTSRGALAMLTRILDALQGRFPRARILVRLDGGFAGPELLHFLDEVCVDYVVGLTGNPVLARLAAPFIDTARLRSTLTDTTEHDYAAAHYAAQTWDRARRVVIKAEVTQHPGRELRDNPRFVVTNLTGDPRRIYEHIYCLRGEIENRIKELHLGLQIDRTSCSRFLANQLRVLLTAAAFVLLQELRRRAVGTRFARAQVWTLREQLLKLGARVVVSARRIVLHLPQAFPFLVPWRHVAIALGGRAG